MTEAPTKYCQLVHPLANRERVSVLCVSLRPDRLNGYMLCTMFACQTVRSRDEAILIVGLVDSSVSIRRGEGPLSVARNSCRR